MIVPNRLKAKGKTKCFCIGQNKTGTTSLRKAFEDIGFPVGDQLTAERLADRYYFKGEFEPIIDYCKSAQVFQDIPFSFPETFKVLDKAYPGSKFILTVRDNPKQWYQSITRFHSKLFGNGRIPSSNDLKKATYVSRGFMYKAVAIHNTPEHDLYNKEQMITHYTLYNQSVIDYFKNRQEDLLVINLADKSSFQRFIDFIGVQSSQQDFPWENKT